MGTTPSVSHTIYNLKNNSSGGNFIRQWVWSGNQNLILNSVYTTDNGPLVFEPNIPFTNNETKVLLAYQKDNFARSIGASLITDTSGNLPVGINELSIGNDGTGGGGAPFNGHIKQLTYYPKRLTNTQLQTLTQ